MVGYDANSLYLYCLAQKLPTGYYTLREKSNGYAKQTRYSKEAIHWLENMIKNDGVNIRHAMNSPNGERRIENMSVDGFDETTNTVYEYYGCYYHGHDCSNKTYNSKKWQATLDREELLKNLGYNVVSTTSCVWWKTPESKLDYETPDTSTICSMNDILDAVLGDELFGLIKLDIHVPSHLIDRFSEFPPIFKNCEINLSDIGEHMQEHCVTIGRTKGIKRSLISSMRGDGIVILTPLLKKYLELGLIVTNIDFVIEYNGKAVFQWFMDKVCNDRRRADMDPAFAVLGETSKTKGNCGYGRTLMDKFKHTKTSFVQEKNVDVHLSNPLFKSLEELGESVFEVNKQKRKVVLDLPIQIGLAVYSYAKLHMLEFWEFINSFLMQSHYQLMEMDTDSLYIAFAKENIDDCVKPELRSRWLKEKSEWFVSEDTTTKVDFDGTDVSIAQWDKRTPGKFKPEFEGLGMICLNSKVYHIWNEKESKTSCKGTQKKRNDLLVEHFREVLDTTESKMIENAGFITQNSECGPIIKTYRQEKRGISYFYAKRLVMEDGVSTTHLDI